MNLNFEQVLYFYDEPQVFSSLDPYGVRYVSLLVEESLYLTFRVTSQLFNEFTLSKLDLLSLLKNSDNFGVIKSPFESKEFVFAEYKGELPKDWLPSEGFVIEPVSQERLAVEAREKKSCIASIGILADESKKHLEIYSDKLSEVVGGVEKIFENIYAAMIKGVSKKEKSNWPSVPPRLLFAGISPGSFKVQLKSDENLDLFGTSKSEQVLAELENILRLLGTKDEKIIRKELKSKYGGKIASSLLKLSDFIVKKDTPIYMEWATPNSYSGRTSYSKEMAAYLCKNFTDGEELSSEEVDYVGELVKVDSLNGSWTLQTKNENGKTVYIYGKTRKIGNVVDLNGLIIKDQTYKLSCEIVCKYDFSQGKEIEIKYLSADPEEI